MAQKEKMSAVLDLRGLDMVTPVDLLKDGRTPFSKNFRLYAQQTDDRRVAVSSRKGPGFYINPLAETLSDANTATTDASTADVGVDTGIHAQPFTATTTGRLTRIDISVADLVGASGPLLVQVYADNGGVIGNLLSESSIASGDIGGTAAYETARFVNAAKVIATTDYWIVTRIQDDGSGTYALSTTTAGTPAWSTGTGLSQIVEQSYGLNFKTYITTDTTDKGAYRFVRDNGVNTTLVAHGESMYIVDEDTNEYVEIIDGLDADATEYRFTSGDNKVFWVNGYDDLTLWDGTLEADATELISNGTFEVNTTGWAATGGGTGNAITRSTSEYHSGVASLSVTATAGANVRSARQTLALSKNHRYKVSYWVKGATAASDSYLYLVGPNIAAATPTNLTTSWQQVTYYFTPTVDVTAVDFRSAANNFYIDDISIVDTGFEYIIDTELPILSDVLFHKDRIWGVSADDPNKAVFSEAPGNPSASPVVEQWYRAWLSVSFIYVPRPHNGSPITAIESFQDSLTVFTQDKKYTITGYDRGSLVLRESTGAKGALSRRGVIADENRIYFASDDGLYEYNGSGDTKISSLINPLFDGCGQKHDITPVLWKNEVRFYMASSGSPVNDTCVIYNKDLKEIMYDTGTFINRALYYNDADDDGQLIELSSVAPVAYNAEQDYHSLGAPIDFEYRLKYDSMGTPAQRKRLKRFYPLLQGVDSTFRIQLAMDKDFEDSPKIKDTLLSVNGAVLGGFLLGDGTLLGGGKSFKMHRQSYSGYAHYWQLRVIRKGVNNRVAFIGAQFSYKTKRL